MTWIMTILLLASSIPSFASERKCSPSKDDPSIEGLINNAEAAQIGFTTPSLDSKSDLRLNGVEDQQFVGFNSILVGCSMYADIKLSTIYSNSVITGLRCLAGINQARKKDSARLLYLLNPNLSKKAVIIRCSSYGDEICHNKFTGITTMRGEGHACDCTTDEFPLVAINQTYLQREFSMKKDNKIASSIFFHELMHLLGYKHTDKIDVVRLMEACCFPGSIDLKLNPHLHLENACDQLKADNKNF